MTTYSWTGTASTDFSNAANWIDTVTGAPAGVPGVKDTVVLSGIGDITGTGAVNAIDVVENSEYHAFYQMQGTFSSNTVSDLGYLAVSQGSLTAHRITVGGIATYGELDITQAAVGALDGRLNITVSQGNAEGMGAALNVGSQDGAIAYGGTLSIGSGSVQVGVGTGQSGVMTVIGQVVGGTASSLIIGQNGGSGVLDELYQRASITAGRLIVGAAGTGQATFSQGGSLTLGGGTGPALVFGGGTDAGSHGGTGSLQGTSVIAHVNGLVLVGATGQGSLTLDNSLLTTGGLVIGDAQSAQGTVTLAAVAWTDTGNVVVGNKGQGTLDISSSYLNGGGSGSSIVNGDVLIGVAGGTGNVTLAGATLTVAGSTVLGASNQDTISIKAGEWNSAGHGVRLVSAPAGRTGSTLSISQNSSFIAGALNVGVGDTVEAFSAGTLALGGSTAGTAGSIAGRLILGQGSTLTAAGNLSVAQSAYNSANGGFTGLELAGGSATLTATRHFALSLVNHGVATVAYGSELVATGGIRVASQGGLIAQQGTVTAQSSGMALEIASGGEVIVEGSGQLNTSGELAIDDSGRHSGQNFGGSLTVLSGTTLDSSAATPGGLAVAINGGSAQIGAADWTVDGRFDVGASGQGGSLGTQGSRIGISGALTVGGYRSHGYVSTGTTDTVISGGTLTAGQTGIAAASIIVGGDGSSINTGTLDVGTASARGSLAINNGAVRVAGAATINGVVRLGDGGLLSAQAITVQANATVLGSGTLSGTIVDQGAIVVSHGLLACLGPVTGDGVLRVGDGTLQLGGTETVGVVFGNAGTLVAPSVSDVAGTLSGWQAGDAILFGQAVASDSYANGTLSLFDSHQALLGTELFTGSLSGGNFVLTQQETGGSLLSFHQ